jgi:hypothetical protein
MKNKKDGRPSMSLAQLGKITAELVAMGVLECVGERPCSITGRMEKIYDVTGQYPNKDTEAYKAWQRENEGPVNNLK